MEPLLIRLQRGLAGRYTVERELGRAGMAVVYLGQDLRLERRVAIKVFEKEGGLISAGERFLREIQVAAKLQHPNILAVFESGEGEGLVYYVMPYVAGGSVRERLEREGPLPVGDAVRIAREVAEALDHHRAGIVHRDIKPAHHASADPRGGWHGRVGGELRHTRRCGNRYSSNRRRGCPGDSEATPPSPSG